MITVVTVKAHPTAKATDSHQGEAFGASGTEKKKDKIVSIPLRMFWKNHFRSQFIPTK